MRTRCGYPCQTFQMLLPNACIDAHLGGRNFFSEIVWQAKGDSLTDTHTHKKSHEMFWQMERGAHTHWNALTVIKSHTRTTCYIYLGSLKADASIIARGGHGWQKGPDVLAKVVLLENASGQQVCSHSTDSKGSAVWLHTNMEECFTFLRVSAATNFYVYIFWVYCFKT